MKEGFIDQALLYNMEGNIKSQKVQVSESYLTVCFQ